MINVVTKRGRDIKGLEASYENSSYSSNKGRLTYGQKLSNGLEFIVSGSYYYSAGQQSLFYQEFNTPDQNNGLAHRMDHDTFQNFFVKASYGDFTMQGGYVGRKKGVPTGAYGTIFNNGQDATVDKRGYLDLTYQHEFASQLTVKGRLYYDRYYFREDYVISYPPPTFNQDRVTTDQVGGELSMVKRLFDRHKIILGSEFRGQFRMDQTNKDVDPPATYLDDKRKSTVWALYLQDEFAITDHLILNAGSRHDHDSTFGGTTNPRVGLIYTWRDRTAKLLYGRAFRAPNPFEQFYTSGGIDKANQDLKPEVITTYEFVLEQYVGHHLRGTASAYYYEIDQLISQVTDPVDGLLVYRNTDRISAKGLEFALEGKWPGGMEGRLSYAIQEARDSTTDFPADGDSVDLLLKSSDIAMYHAKEQGRNNFQYYSATMNALAADRLEMENELRKALERHELIVHYQPQVDIRSNHIVGAEALVRWPRPERGMLMPAVFLPVAIETGMIRIPDEEVLAMACRQNKQWQDAGYAPIRISVNVSNSFFHGASLTNAIAKALADTQLNPECLELELTEPIIMRKVETSVTMLQELRAMGVRLSIDDFGTGYSSLSYLQRFPLNRLKIDQSFARDSVYNVANASITRAIISLAHSMNLSVLAEGVETDEQLALLRQQGCDEVQGHLLGRPMPAHSFAELLSRAVPLTPKSRAA